MTVRKPNTTENDYTVMIFGRPVTVPRQRVDEAHTTLATLYCLDTLPQAQRDTLAEAAAILRDLRNPPASEGGRS